MLPSQAFTLGYRPALDGLRAVSILAVLLYHTDLISGGFLGVDVFFALSGFLITSLLLEEHATTGRVSFYAFYVRRALRLLPALAPLVVIVGGAMIAADPQWRTVGFVLSVVFYVANWATIYGLRQGLLGHTWSLAIEEQFYILWPPLLWLLLCVVRRRGLLLLLMTSVVALAVAHRFALQTTREGMARSYVALDAHADPLLIGCTIAIFCASSFFRRGPRAVVVWHGLGVVGGVALLALLVRARFPVDYVHASVSTFAAIASVLVIIATLMPSSPCAAVLRCPPLPWIGRRSYALYLWHYPVFAFAGPLWHPGVATPQTALLAWAVSFALAAASFRYIEQPALSLKVRLSQPHVSARLERTVMNP